MGFIKQGIGKIKEIGRFMKKEGKVVHQTIIKDGYYICPHCNCKVCEVGQCTGTVSCPDCKIKVKI